MADSLSKEGKDISCKCGGTYVWVESLNALVCAKCGRHASYQPKPKYDELLKENERLKAEVEYYKKQNEY